MNHHLSPSHLMDETKAIEALLAQYDFNAAKSLAAKNLAKQLIQSIRQGQSALTDIEQFLVRYPLTSPQGLALMRLAETLLRVPDDETADKLISETLLSVDWSALGGDDLFGKSLRIALGLAQKTSGSSLWGGLTKGALRHAIGQMVKHLGSQFVIAETIEDATKEARSFERNGFRMSYDMLGEGARTMDDATRYFESYLKAIQHIGQSTDKKHSIYKNPSVSVKLSALHPRYQWNQSELCIPIMIERMKALCTAAMDAHISLTIDAEESDRLPLSLNIIKSLMNDADLKDWQGLGVAVQAYDKRCLALIDLLITEAGTCNRRLQLRLVKGAYWDSEIKRAQVMGLDSYPVFTRKLNTDLSYLAAAQKMLKASNEIYPMFATHNVMTAAQILNHAPPDSEFEFQRLYGMGADLAERIHNDYNRPVSIYAPVGSYHDLLPYLVRRMLENGANSSFVSNLRQDSVSADTLCIDPYEAISLRKHHQHTGIPLPRDIYGDARKNSAGLDLSDPDTKEKFINLVKSADISIEAMPILPIDTLFKNARAFFPTWEATAVQKRADYLYKIADEFENNMPALINILQDEGKKTLYDAINEVREAVDFARYYAALGLSHCCPKGINLMSPTGEENILRHGGRGIFVAINPWNFPLAIFCGQIFAAIITGNVVIAKPAEQTPRIADFCLSLFRRVGLPNFALQILHGDGATGAALVQHIETDAVVFTGSSQTAKFISRSLAAKEGAITPFIAETGGLNAMIIDNTALPEHVVDDVMQSAFGSAGQRCSALRVLYVPHDIADNFIRLLKGAIALWRTGDAHDVSSDMSALIDREAYTNVYNHCEDFKTKHTLIACSECSLPPPFIAAHIFEIRSIRDLQHEIFGPVLHIIRYHSSDLHQIIQEINDTGYGLTGGVHSRLLSTQESLTKNLRVGNLYINRSMIGAVVGVQPFGGRGLSGTGPKAGGPHYLQAFTTEYVVSNNTSAVGGNLKLLTLPDEVI